MGDIMNVFEATKKYLVQIKNERKKEANMAS